MTLESAADTFSLCSRLLAKEELSVELDGLFRSRGDGGAPNETRINPIGARHNRRTFEAASTETGCHTVIGKFCAVGRPDLFVTMQQILRSGFGTDYAETIADEGLGTL